MDSFLYQASIYLLAAVVAVPVAARLGFGSVLGYLVAGIAIGPLFGLVGTDVEGLQQFGEFGVVMMLFLIGLELAPRALWDMRHRLLGLGGLQIVLTIAAVTAATMAIGETWQQGIAAGTILSLSSTAIVLQTLDERGLTTSPGGRSTFAVLLAQDLAVIPMLALLPLLVFAPLRRALEASAQAEDGAPEAVHAARSLIESLPAWEVPLVTLGAVGLVILLGLFLIRPLFRWVLAARLPELNTALALLIVLGIALLMSLVGLSPALGTFLAGVVLANSEFRHELESDIGPFKGLLLGLFFITVGAGINFGIVFDRPFVVLGLTVGVMALKGLVLLGLGALFRLRGRDLWLFTLGLAQAGEFGFVLISFTHQQHVIPTPLAESLQVVIALSMLLTPLAFLLYGLISRGLGDGTAEHVPPRGAIEGTSPVIIAGIGRYGQVVNRLVSSSGFATTVIDNDLATVELIRRFGYKAFFGDPLRPEILRAAGITQAAALVVALDDPKAALRLVIQARRVRPDLYIVARARDRLHTFQLNRAGADKVVREVFDSSLRTGRYVLEFMGLSEWEAHEAERTFYDMDRNAIRDLAAVWDEQVPFQNNPRYMDLSRKLNKDLEAALMHLNSEGDEGAA